MLSRKQQRAITLLLEPDHTLKEVAATVGVSEKTLWRWLQLADFTDRLRSLQSQALADAILLLQAASVTAARRLITNMALEKFTNAQASLLFASNAAATQILSLAIKGNEQLLLLQRVESLEALLKPTGRSKWA